MAGTVDWDRIRSFAHANIAPPDDWPKGIKPISLEGAALFGLDADFRLYWDGKLVQVSRRFDLTFWQKVGAVLTVGSAVAVAVVTVANFLIELL